MMTRFIRRYSELITLPTFEERMEYLMTRQTVGDPTFSGKRVLNQDFYRSTPWKTARQITILRDRGCDLGVLDRPIYGRILVHHMVPLLPEDMTTDSPFLLDPDYLITVSHDTHNAIHYGRSVPIQFTERRPGDTNLW